MDINIVKLNNFDLNKIVLSKSYSIYTNNKKISIGYDNYSDLHLLSPIFINNINYSIYQNLKIRFEPLLGDILHFYNSINDIEQKIKNHITKHNKDYNLCSIIKTDKTDLFDDTSNDYIKYISIDLTKNTTYKIYNNNSEECALNNLKNGLKFKTLLKIDYVWINTFSKKFGLHIDLIQLKIIQPIATLKCLIDTDLNKDNEIIVKDIVEYKVEKKPSINNTNNISIQQNSIIVDKVIFRPPDASQLLLMKSSLKKVIE